MPHVEAPRPADSHLPVFFNLDSSVGNRGANSNHDDILLVQFLLKAMTLRVTTPEGALAKPILSRTPQTGVVDQATIESIMTFQEAQKKKGNAKVVDGRVSPAKGYRYNGGFYTIVLLNGLLREDFRHQWPRLDQIPGCPGRITQLMGKLL